LIEFAYNQLRGEYPDESGHYITAWAPRQCGKTLFTKAHFKEPVILIIDEFDALGEELIRGDYFK
jgi:AAA+ superfamily predicted ATPase